MKIFGIKKGYGAGMAVAAAVIAVAIGIFLFSLRPVNAAGDVPDVVFQVSQGEGFRAIGAALKDAGLIRSPLSFDIAAVLDGRAGALKAGSYRLSPSMSTSAIIGALSANLVQEVTVTIPEDSNVFGIDRILAAALVVRPGEFSAYALAQGLEGSLFPDTYRFYTNEDPAAVAATMAKNFNAKAAPLLSAAPASEARNIIIASIVEKEVPDQADQKLVAGIILRRLSLGMPLDIDATICYAKLLVAGPTSTEAVAGGGCSLTALDFSIKSPYNTYLYKGLPPGPIGNPGTSAITAALHPQSSPYLYYLTDPKTGKTIFAKTLDEQNQNRVKYLESN
jgi:peptidoglycan lytic transglycosylase G